MRKSILIIALLLTIGSACTKKAPLPPTAATIKQETKSCVETQANHFSNPKSAVENWIAATNSGDYCRMILSHRPVDRSRFTLMTLEEISGSIAGAARETKGKAILDYLKKSGVADSAKSDPDQKIEELSKDPNFFVGLMTALQGGDQLPKQESPKEIQLTVKEKTAQAKIIWPENHSPAYETISLIQENNNWYLVP